MENIDAHFWEAANFGYLRNLNSLDVESEHVELGIDNQPCPGLVNRHQSSHESSYKVIDAIEFKSNSFGHENSAKGKTYMVNALTNSIYCTMMDKNTEGSKI